MAAVECRKFAPNIFNKSKCSACFRLKEDHSASAIELNKASRKISKCVNMPASTDNRASLSSPPQLSSNHCHCLITVNHLNEQVRLPVCSSRLGLLQPDKPDEAMAATLVRPLRRRGTDLLRRRSSRNHPSGDALESGKSNLPWESLDLLLYGPSTDSKVPSREMLVCFTLVRFGRLTCAQPSTIAFFLATF